MDCPSVSSRCALEELYRAHFQAVLAFARRAGGGAYADDVAQEVFLRVLNYRGDRLGEVTLPYLFRVARNVIVDLRRRGGRAPMTNAPALESEDALPARGARRVRAYPAWPAWLIAGVQSLPPREREILMLTELRGLTELQTGRSLRISRSAVSARKLSALRRLRGLAAQRECPELSRLDAA